jgi:hypothetical protein
MLVGLGFKKIHTVFGQGQVRDDRLCHRSNLFMVSGVSKNRILNPER